jgi:hypothetical protein
MTECATVSPPITLRMSETLVHGSKAASVGGRSFFHEVTYCAKAAVHLG